MDIKSLFDVSGRTALITGGNSGIGEAMAKAVGFAGASVVLVARREKALAAAARAMRESGIRADYMAFDLHTPENALACGQSALDVFGKIDILINAAGINLREPFMGVTPHSWNLQLALHVTAPFFLTKALAPAMAARQWGRIINVASLQSYRAFDDSSPYGTAKGGIIQLTRAIAQEWSGKGINCNALGPGFFPTPLTEALLSDQALAQRYAAQSCVGRNGRLEDLYGCTIFLASEASAYVTGQTIMVDGGFTAR